MKNGHQTQAAVRCGLHRLLALCLLTKGKNKFWRFNEIYQS